MGESRLGSRLATQHRMERITRIGWFFEQYQLVEWQTTMPADAGVGSSLLLFACLRGSCSYQTVGLQL